MSEKSDELEIAIFQVADSTDSLPKQLPTWLINMGAKPENKIISAKKIGSDSTKNKTDVVIQLENAPPIKISAKLQNAHYFGNWYTQSRIIEEFGEDTFYRLTKGTTEWANKWKLNPKIKSPFVGVSISFGERKGETGVLFNEIFASEDIIKIVAGDGLRDRLNVANCLYKSSEIPKTITEIINNLREIDDDLINEIGETFKVVFRPVYPLTSGGDIYKNVFTKYQPYKKNEEVRLIDNVQELFELGAFVEVELKPPNLNHNHILKELESDYNIKLLLKPKKTLVKKGIQNEGDKQLSIFDFLDQ